MLYIAPKLGAVADGDNILREVVRDHNGVGKGKIEVIHQAGSGLGDFAGRIKPWRNVIELGGNQFPVKGKSGKCYDE